MSGRIIIIGGMGPQASLELHRRMLHRAAIKGARFGSDFPEIIHVSLPIDDFISDKRKTIKALNLIQNALESFYYQIWRQMCPGMQYCTFTSAPA